MKRINLSVNMEDNQVLDQSIEEALKAHARQIARETVNKELESEIQRITKARFDEVKAGGYWGVITGRITESVVKRLDTEIKLNMEDINKIIEDKVNTYLDAKIKNRNGLDSFIESYIDKSIVSILTKRAISNG